MSLIATFILFITVTLPIAWLVSEYKTKKRWVRISLGIASLICIGDICFFFVKFTERLNYNSWYGFANEKLIKTIISKLEEGQTEVVINNLKKLEKDFYPTYENKGNFNELAEQATNNMQNNKK